MLPRKIIVAALFPAAVAVSTGCGESVAERQLRQCLVEVDSLRDSALVADSTGSVQVGVRTAPFWGFSPGGGPPSYGGEVRFRCEDEQACRPEEITVRIAGSDFRRAVSETDTLIFSWRSGGRLEVVEAAYSATVDTVGDSVPRTLVKEEWEGSVPLVEFGRMACADSVRFRLGEIQAQVTPAATSHLRSLLKVLTPY